MQSTAESAARITSVKFVIAGGFGVGKTTFVGAISEIEPLRTEAAMTSVERHRRPSPHPGQDDHHRRHGLRPHHLDDAGHVPVRHARPGPLRLHGDDICLGALGSVVLVDPRRITDSFPGIDYFEANAIPFVIGVNVFDGAPLDQRDPRGLGVADDTPIVDCDACNKDSVKMVLLTLLESLGQGQALSHALIRRRYRPWR